MPLFKKHSLNLAVHVKSGTELLQMAKKHPELALKFGCTKGNCGVCAIEVVSGESNLSKQSEHERETLKQKKLGAGWRLACQCAMNGDVEIA